MANLYFSLSGQSPDIDAALESISSLAQRGASPPERLHYARTEDGTQIVVQGDFTPDEQAQLQALGFQQLGEYRVWRSGWEVGMQVAAGDVLLFDNLLYRVIQTHTTQADWTPDVAISLWTRYYESGEIPAWVQPTGAHDAYPLGFKVTHGGFIWQSLVNANVWQPGAVGSEALWENLTPPPVTPEWAAGVLYHVGDVVIYQGVSYRCLQQHTSISTWTPNVVPALWLLLT